MTDSLEYLRQVSEASGVVVSVTALLVKVFSTILHENPELNVVVVNGRIQRRKSVDVFCQVSIPSKGNSSADLSGVKLTDAPSMDLVEIAERLQRRATKLRAGQDEEMEQTKKTVNVVPSFLMRGMLKVSGLLTYNLPIEMGWMGLRSDPFGSMMISSIAGFGINHGYAPLVPASRCPMVILVGATHDVAMVHEGEVKPRKGITFSATFDHRLYDGYQIGIITRGFHAMMRNPAAYFEAPEHWVKKAEEAAEALDALKGAGSVSPK